MRSPDLIKPVNSPTVNNNQTKDKKKKYPNFHDPLNQWGIKCMSYSNEVGTAISEIAPRVGAALWAPTFMYLGADIYDKYKNDKNGFNPSAKRALERAIFQGITTLIALPAVIFAGQKIVSPIARLSKFGISTNAKDAVIKHTRAVIDQSRGEILDSYDKFSKVVITTLKNKLDARKNEKKTVNIFKKVINFFTDKYPMVNSNRERLLAYAEENAKKVFEIKTALQNGDKKSVPGKIMRKYNSVLPAMKEMYGHDYSRHALRTSLKEYQNSLIFKNKLLKTLGGFIALTIFAGPVNKYVENTVMKKYINPEIDQISREFVTNSRMKAVFSEMDRRKSNFPLILNKNALSLNRFWAQQLKPQP